MTQWLVNEAMHMKARTLESEALAKTPEQEQMDMLAQRHREMMALRAR